MIRQISIGRPGPALPASPKLKPQILCFCEISQIEKGWGKLGFLGNRVTCHNVWPFIVSGTWEQYERAMVHVFQFLSPILFFCGEKDGWCRQFSSVLEAILCSQLYAHAEYRHGSAVQTMLSLVLCCDVLQLWTSSSCRGGKPQRRVKPSLIK